ncbi:serine/threonine protein phosphatase 2A 55 kDa regulatory subunit B beta isoform-like [Olea europaea var. sylvestris]|uniref:serine/threonine protein phosphatase 2A 55 kDa regulatory subunit B beta isoform-like n=1 Tax=Olea europaea var. sylvestris TaxID=158386 RepID=UPI000C1CDBD6|nr:serine/threonine protein phosphatase 2A 55 kDa regulatory subunit B beta isoform-like [Olea europaea var. sylvestris]
MGIQKATYVDIISAIEFDQSGDHFAIGDRGGRVVLFERNDAKDHGGNRKDLEMMDYPGTRHSEFHYKTEFQSLEPEMWVWMNFTVFVIEANGKTDGFTSSTKSNSICIQC